MSRRLALKVPWSVPGDPYSARGSLLLKLALGEAPESIPAALEVRMGDATARVKLGVRAVDRVLEHFARELEVYRVHRPAQGQRFNDLEEALGLSRTFEVDTDDDFPVADAVDALRQLAVVEQAYPHYLSTLPLAAAPAPAPAVDLERAWQVRGQVRAAEAMAYEPGDEAMIMGVVDTGVRLDHPELVPQLRRGADCVQLIAGDLPAGARLVADVSKGCAEPDDLQGHGTSVAAIMAAVGLEIPRGLAGECNVLPMRALAAARFLGRQEPVGIGAIADIDLAVKRGVDLGAKVLNLSFGTPAAALEQTGSPPHWDVVQYGLARGCVMVAASGNNAQCEEFYPAAIDGVIAVGAVDLEDHLCPFTTRGPHVALSGPGERVPTASLAGYSLATGTSFAAPFVAAAAALLVCRGLRRAHALDGWAVKRILCESARPWPAGQGEGGGAGILDAYAALRALDREIDESLAAPARRTN